MWCQFIARASKIFPDRTAFYYFRNECVDIPEEWALEFFRQGVAVPAEGPAEFAPAVPRVPASLGDDRLTVACVHRHGGPYDGRGYVGRLARAVARNLSLPHRFVCLTDRPEAVAAEDPAIEAIALRHDWPGFWPKVELYRPGLFSGPVLYFDLDTVICGPIDDIAACDVPVLAAWDLQRGWLNSSFLRWSVDLSAVYDAMVEDTAAVRLRYSGDGREPESKWGDQGLLQDVLTERAIPWRWVQAAFPHAVQWHPIGTRHAGPPEGTHVALWYGHPKPHEVGGSDWLDRHWT